MTTRAEFSNPVIAQQHLTSEELERLLDFQRGLLEAIVVRKDYAAMLDEVCRQAESLTPNALASVMLYRADAEALYIESAPSASAEAIEALNGLRAGDGSCGNVVFHNEAMYVCDTLADARWRNVVALALKLDIRSCFGFPIFAGGRQSIGSFALSSPDPREPVGFHRRLLQTCASLCGIILRRRADERMREEVLEEQLRSARLESVSVVAGGIAHDFNNLLTSIVGHLDIAHAALPPGNVRANLERALRATERAQGLTTQLLTVARGGSPARQPTDILAVVRDAAAFVLHGGNVRAEIMNNCQEPAPIVNVDGGQIGQLVQNLVLNARQAMPDGGVVTITSDLVDHHSDPVLQSGTYLRIIVSDTGSGIPEAVRDQLFDPYVTAKEHGTGLGLFVCDSIVKAHDGLIRVHHADHEGGASFVIYLPFEADLASNGPTPTPAPVTETAAGGRVLIMDDEADVRDVLGQMLCSLNFQVAAASDGDEAVRLYEQAYLEGKPFDVTIVDLTVPGGVGGIETRDRIRAINPAAKIVVSSGYPTGEGSDATEQFSASLPKPYRIAELEQVLSAIAKP